MFFEVSQNWHLLKGKWIIHHCQSKNNFRTGRQKYNFGSSWLTSRIRTILFVIEALYSVSLRAVLAIATRPPPLAFTSTRVLDVRCYLVKKMAICDIGFLYARNRNAQSSRSSGNLSFPHLVCLLLGDTPRNCI